MIDWLKKNKYWIAAGSFVLFILGPLAINFLFAIGDTHPILRVKWDARDVLGFYGAILAAGGTIAGVFLSIQYSQKSYKEDMLNRVLPYFSLQCYQGVIDIFRPAESGELAIMINARREIQFKRKQVLPKGFQMLAFEIDNVGNGPAVNFSLSFFREDVGPDSRYTAPKTMVVGNTFGVNIMYDGAAVGNYIIRLHYRDIYGTRYYQDFRFEVSVEGHGIDMSGAQGKTDKDGIPIF